METELSAARRRRGPEFITSNACTECRKKRTKCDGKTPCKRCASQNVANCIYELPAKQTKQEMRAEINRLQASRKNSIMILDALATDRQSASIIQQLQNGKPVENIAKNLDALASSSSSNKFHDDVQASTCTSNIAYPSSKHGPQPSSVEASHPLHLPDATDIHCRTEVPEVDSSRHLEQQTIFDEPRSQGSSSRHSPGHNSETWTTITSDKVLVEHLIALYFCWEYPIFATVSKDHFLEDFRDGRARYCSPLLVNALLSLACRYSSHPTTRANLDDGTTAGDAFFAEASDLLRQEEDRRSLTTVQALGIMSIREASCGRLNESKFLSEQSIHLVIEMGLHLDTPEPDHKSDADEAVRAATFWGAMSLNEMLSLLTGSLPPLSQHINFPTKPALIQHVEEAIWSPYTDDGSLLDERFNQPSNLRSVYQTFCELSEKVHNTLYVLYSPVSQVESRTLVALYSEYINWYDTIPDSLRLGHNSTPAVVFAHLFYHSATLLLFQPFIQLHLITSTVSPQAVCLQAANAISGLVKSYSNLYTLRHTPSFVPYFALISTVVHLAAVKRDYTKLDPRRNLCQGILDLKEMAACHGFALRAVGAIRYLAYRWGVNLPTTNVSSGDLANIHGSSIVLSDPIYPDPTILETLQSIRPVIVSNDPSAFSEFPLPTLPLSMFDPCSKENAVLKYYM